jgi:NADH:ubiquinone oxidoreductase subunit E
LGIKKLLELKIEGIKKMANIDITHAENLLEGKEGASSELIEVLQDVQDAYNYLPEEVLLTVSERLNVPQIEVFRVANFYKAFTLQPRGKHLLTICMGTACHVRGAQKLIDDITALLGIKPGETTDDGKFTLETVNCLGACALGPVAVLDGNIYDHMTPAKLHALVQDVSQETT